MWAIGDVNGNLAADPRWRVRGGDIVASNILGEPRPANYEAVPRVVYTDPQPALGMQPQPPAKLQDQGAMVQLYSVLAWETTNYNTLT